MDLGSMAVYFVLKKLWYEVPERSGRVINIMRFIDDVTGQALAPLNSFAQTLESLRLEMVEKFSLDITYEVRPVEEPSQFLDIMYSFTENGLNTDLYRKSTDANRYLQYSSFQTRHVYRGVVYS